MEWLNYHHLFYFWTVARQGSVTQAAAELRLGQPTISTQLRSLEESLGEKLFRRVGRNLVLTDAGRNVFRYADEIFSLGQQLLDVVNGRDSTRGLRLVVGVADVVPKLVTHRLLAPALQLPEPVHLICREDKGDRLLAELAVHAFDLVITDAPVGPATRVRAFSHLVGECSVTFCAVPVLARKYRRGFPGSLSGAPLLLPTDNTVLRGLLNGWFDRQGIRPVIRCEFEDSALLKAFGQAGAGIFVVPSVIEDEVRRRYGAEVVGRVDGVQERFYAISLERRLTHPAVVAITNAARRTMLG